MAIDRYFLGWDQPALPLVADYLVQRYASTNQLNLAGVILVFPGRRAAHRMLELLVDHAAARYPEMIPPRMVTFSHFPELLYLQKKKLADDLTQLLVWKQAVNAVPEREIRPAIATLPPEDSLPSWMKLCDSLRRQHEELAAESLNFDDVFRTVARTNPGEEADRWKALWRIQAEYLMQMDGVELWDRQTARLVAVDQQECRTEHDIVLVGTVDMNGIVKKMLDQVADRVTALVYAPESIAACFDAWGCLVPSKWLKRSIHVPDELTRVANDPQDQAEAVIGHLRSLDGGHRADEIVIGVADDSLVPVIVQALARVNLNGRWPIGSHVRASPPWRLLDAVARHLATAKPDQAPDFPTLADLVRHPDVAAFIEKQLQQRNPEAASTWLSDLDHYQADHLQPVPGRMLGPRRRAEVVTAICTAVEQLLLQLISGEAVVAHRNDGMRHRDRSVAPAQMLLFEDSSEEDRSAMFGQLTRRRSLSAWISGTVRLLNLIYSDYLTGEDLRRDESMVACLSALNQCTETLSKIPAAVLPKCTAAQAISVLLMQTGDKNIAASSDDSAIDLVGWLELPLDDSPVVTVAGFNEGRIPRSASSDVFLPNSVRSKLGLTDNQRRYARDAWALETLLHNRKRVRFIAGRRDAQGDPLAPSRLWFSGQAKDIPARVLRFYGDGAEADPLGEAETTENPALSQPASRTHSGFLVPAPSQIPQAPNRIPVTHFRDYIMCPYRYFLRRELGLASIEDNPREMDGRLFGNLIHTVLNQFGRSEIRDARDAERIEKALRYFLRQEADENFGTQLSATVAVQLQMAEARLKGFAEWQARQSSDGWVIEFSERKLECEFHDVFGRPVTINGRVDRIDRHRQSGEWRVLDYKTGENPHRPQKTHRRKGDWIDLQLPLYRLLVRGLGVDGDVWLGYMNLPGDLTQVGASIADWTPEDLATADETARQVAADILDMRIEAIKPAATRMNDDLTRICQDTVVDAQTPWLSAWSGRSVTVRK